MLVSKLCPELKKLVLKRLYGKPVEIEILQIFYISNFNLTTNVIVITVMLLRFFFGHRKLLWFKLSYKQVYYRWILSSCYCHKMKNNILYFWLEIAVKSSKASSIGVIVGIAAGCLFLIVIAVVIIYVKKQRQGKKEDTVLNPGEPLYMDLPYVPAMKLVSLDHKVNEGYEVCQNAIEMNAHYSDLIISETGDCYTALSKTEGDDDQGVVDRDYDNILAF